MRPPERCAGGHQLGGKERMSKKYLYYFSEGNDAFGGDKVTMKNTLGGKRSEEHTSELQSPQ